MTSIDPKFDGEIFRKDHINVIAQDRHLAVLNPVRLAYDADGFIAGRVLGLNSVSGLYENYDDGASSGLDTARCVLFESHGEEEFGGSTGSVIARGIFGGLLHKDKLLGLDSAAETDLDAKTITDASGIVVLKF